MIIDLFVILFIDFAKKSTKCETKLLNSEIIAGESGMSVIENACTFAVDVANDNTHGYDQINRWLNPDVDCSSLVISSFEHAGLKVKENGATYTGNMRNAFLKCGFKSYPYTKGMRLIRGDVLLNEQHHTALYLGDNKIVQASINEKGTTKGGKKGDQTGREVYVGNFYEYSKGWQYILRYQEEEKKEEKKVNIQLTSLSYGSIGEEVRTVQRLLNALGYKGANGKNLTVDGKFGDNVLFAVNKLQQDFLGYHDGIVGQKTWTKLLTGK